VASEQDSGQELRFRSDMTVELVKHCASDSDVVWAARVSTVGEQSFEDQRSAEQSQGLINYLMRDRHGSPFEHSSMTFLVTAPIFVFREFHRHRVGWSYNDESGRYRELAPVFYTPAADRKLIQQGRPGKYHFVEGTPEQLRLTEAASFVVRRERKCMSERALQVAYIDEWIPTGSTARANSRAMPLPSISR